jgi:hypothetical protein
MYTVFDSVTQTLIETFDDYESAEMFLLHVSDLIADGGANLSIEPITTVQDWAADNGIVLDGVMVDA